MRVPPPSAAVMVISDVYKRQTVRRIINMTALTVLDANRVEA